MVNPAEKAMPRISPVPTSRSSGFTLVETLVALVLLGFTLAVLSQSVWVMLRTEQRLLEIRRAALAAEQLHVGWILNPEGEPPDTMLETWRVDTRDMTDDAATPQPRQWTIYQLQSRSSAGQDAASIARLQNMSP